MQGLINNNHDFEVLPITEWYPVVVTDHFTISSLKIIGIADSMRSQQFGDFVNTTSAPEYFYLFTNYAGQPVFEKRVQWDLTEPYRILKMDAGDQYCYESDTCCFF